MIIHTGYHDKQASLGYQANPQTNARRINDYLGNTAAAHIVLMGKLSVDFHSTFVFRIDCVSVSAL